VIYQVRRREDDIVVAVLTHIRRLNVHRVLTDCVRAVVATEAVRGDVDVIKVRRYPRNGCMTIIAIVAAAYMCRVLAFGNRAVVARAAGANDLGMVHLVGRCKGDRVMAIIATVGSVNVLRVLANRNSPVVAGTACANYLRMVHLVSRSECHIVVTVLANITGLDMRWVLACGVNAVMAVEAVVHDIGVIESGGNPARGCMAVIAVIAAIDVCRILAFGDGAIVARVTGTDNLCVIYQVSRREDDVVVAVLADIGRLNMCWVLTCRISAIVTTEAVAGYVNVIEIRRNPGRGCMAVIATVAAIDMRRVLAFRNSAVVAGSTGTDNLCVIHLVCR